MLKKLFIILISSVLQITAMDSLSGCGHQFFTQWEKQQAPTFRYLYRSGLIQTNSGILKNTEDYLNFRLVNLKAFETLLDIFLNKMIEQYQSAKWLDLTEKYMRLFDESNQTFLPFAQKEEVAPGTQCLFKGDLHGDLHGLMRTLETLPLSDTFKITDPNFRLIFLGDYVDRGMYGVENIFVLMLLKVINPSQVILIRGNHEDPAVADLYGFRHEFFSKFADEPQSDKVRVYNKLSSFYHLLPVVLYLGCGNNYIQCCHGGMEIGYNPQIFLKSDKQYHAINTLNRATACVSLPDMPVIEEKGYQQIEHSLSFFCQDCIPLTPSMPTPLGFMWHDFIANPSEPCKYSFGRGLACNKALTHLLLEAASSETHKVIAVIRAHQHTASDNDPLMRLMLKNKGCATLWNQPLFCNQLIPGSVYTLLLSSDTLGAMPTFGFSGFEFDTTLQIITAPQLKEWKLDIISQLAK